MPRLRSRLRALLPAPRLDRPVVIVGCGRSGTTILGRVLQTHPDLTYLNEARDLWRIDPRTDIWSDQAAARGGRVVLRAEDLTRGQAAALRRAFAARLKPGQRLVEKLPINNFRVPYVDRVLPGALFVYIERGGLDVAASIAREAGRYAWFGHADYKWQRLVEIAAAQGLADQAARAGDDPFLRGLLEWRLSVQHARRDLAALPDSRVLRLHYEGFLAAPVDTYTRIESFIGAASSQAPRDFARTQITRQHPPTPLTALPADQRAAALDIGGGLLGAAGEVVG